jgi:hypothetical protein
MIVQRRVLPFLLEADTMVTVCKRMMLAVFCFTVGSSSAFAQASISGRTLDEQEGVIPGAMVTVRHLETNATRTLATTEGGRFYFSNLPVGTYEIRVELPGFATHVRTGVRLALNQDAVMDLTLQPAGLEETVTVQADSPILNTTSPEVGVRWDTRRVAELPVINSRDVFSLALSAAGVSQLGSGQTGFANGTNFSVNGARLRSNNFMLDGQDSNDPSVTGRSQPINNTDIVQEIRLVTNQFSAEFGRSAGAVMNVVTKSGTNVFRGTGFVFHNNNEVNARSNLDKRAGREKAPYRLETQYGGTIGGPLLRERTFFFGGFQRWTDRRLGAGTTLNGAPTAAGRAVLEQAAGDLPQVQALLRHLPVADAPIGRSVTFDRGGQTYTVEQGSLTGSADILLNNSQPTLRIDHQLSTNHTLTGRYLYNTEFTSGVNAQVTPPGLLSTNDQSQHATNVWLTSIVGTRTTNEFRVAHQRYGSNTQAVDPTSLEIPSIEISPLGLTGFNAAASRTAIGFGVNLPQFRYNDVYQFQNTTTYVTGNHTFKGGVDIRHTRVESFFVPTIRGLLRYATMQQFIDDVPEAFQLNSPLRGGQSINYYTWNDFFGFAQDEWRVRPDLTLNLGLRYELTGNTIQPLIELNQSILEANNNDERFRLSPVPDRDTNNFQPRVGFNWNPRTTSAGIVRRLTGGDRLVLRGGYARTNDQAFLNMALNVATAFPFIGAVNAPGLPNAFARLPAIAADPTSVVPNVNMLARTTLAEDLRMPHMNQYSLEIQRALAENLSLRMGYVGTQGRGLFQSLEANPTMPVPLPNGNWGNQTTRRDPTRGVIRERANAASSSYHSLQTSLEKRLSGGLSAGAHYTWSKFIDTISEVFNPSSGEVAAAQDPFDIENDKAVSAYDRPHRFTANAVWEVPWLRDQQGVMGKVLGGWQVSTQLTLQSGAPFTALNGVDVANVLAGSLVGNAIRPNINTDLKTHRMTIEELIAAGGANLFSPLVPGVHRVGNVGRNTLRADGIGNIDFGFVKNTRLAGGQNIQLRVEMFNATNTRNFGIPEGRINNPGFLNQWATDGGARRIWGALRVVF